MKLPDEFWEANAYGVKGGVEPAFMVVYAICFAISGAVIAGLGSWLLMRALAATGALSRFAAGRERTAEV